MGTLQVGHNTFYVWSSLLFLGTWHLPYNSVWIVSSSFRSVQMTITIYNPYYWEHIMVNVQCVQIDYRLFIFYRNRLEMSRGNLPLWKIYYLGKCAMCANWLKALKTDNIANKRKIPEVLLKVERCIWYVVKPVINEKKR